jgi:hypothetical protein
MNADTVHQEPQAFRKTARNLTTVVAALILTAAACFLLAAA